MRLKSSGQYCTVVLTNITKTERNITFVGDYLQWRIWCNCLLMGAGRFTRLEEIFSKWTSLNFNWIPLLYFCTFLCCCYGWLNQLILSYEKIAPSQFLPAPSVTCSRRWVCFLSLKNDEGTLDSVFVLGPFAAMSVFTPLVFISLSINRLKWFRRNDFLHYGTLSDLNAIHEYNV